ncbi:MAG: hypothetical protein ACYC35_18805 [Pirellulales bacterium]
MRFLITSGTLMLALALVSLATAAGPGSGFKGGSMGSGFKGSGFMGSGSLGSGSMHLDSHNYNSHNYNWNHNYPWYGGYYPYYGYRYYGDAYLAERPILVNPLPSEVFSGEPIRIVNPASSRATLSYSLNGIVYRIQPGESQDLREDRAWVIEFNRGGNFGPAQYRLRPGVYSFSFSDHGWELYAGLLGPISAGAGNPPPPSPAPVNPLPTP